jgi:hypothetical protein
MTTPATRPVLHLRLIGSRALVEPLAATLAAGVRAHLGTNTTCTTQTRTTRQIGHIRLYLTATRKENTTDDQHHR